MAIKNILVTGAGGQLGNEMQVIAAFYPAYHFLFVTKEQLSIEDGSAVEKYFIANDIDACVNCAAYTAVDKAETETAMAFKVNAEAVGNLASVCKKLNAVFIHISTDYVFDGTSTVPYKEDHPVNPVNAYGASKLKGEQLAMQHYPDSVIIRTSWVYSSFGNNFVKTMLRLMNERESIKVVDDQVGCATYAADLATAIMKIIEQENIVPGIYNFSNSGVINWYQFATVIKELSGSNCKVNPIPAAQYPTPAKRPQYSVLDTTKISQTFGVALPEWKESLQKCLALLGKYKNV
jgi:dTDP-4-dehydrorhamnose reductase